MRDFHYLDQGRVFGLRRNNFDFQYKYLPTFQTFGKKAISNSFSCHHFSKYILEKVKEDGQKFCIHFSENKVSENNLP